MKGWADDSSYHLREGWWVNVCLGQGKGSRAHQSPVPIQHKCLPPLEHPAGSVLVFYGPAPSWAGREHRQPMGRSSLRAGRQCDVCTARLPCSVPAGPVLWVPFFFSFYQQTHPVKGHPCRSHPAALLQLDWIAPRHVTYRWEDTRGTPHLLPSRTLLDSATSSLLVPPALSNHRCFSRTFPWLPWQLMMGCVHPIFGAVPC